MPPGCNLPKCLIPLLKMSKCSRTAVYKWSRTVKSGIDLFSCTPCAPPMQVCRFQSQCWHVPWRTHPVWLIHQPSVFLRFRTRGLRWATGIHWDPDCNEMPCLALYLADVVWFSPNVKTRFKMVQNKQYAVIRYFPYTTEKIHTPYLYHQESRNISHLTQTPSCYS